MIQNLHVFEAGYTLHPEASVLKNGSFKKIPFPAQVCVFEHKKYGIILFDTGYSEQFKEFTQSFPESIYRWVTPVFIDSAQTCVSQLKIRGINPKDVQYIIISHFHADHIGGLRDFPCAKFIYYEDALRTLNLNGRLKKTLNGFIPQFLPDDFKDRSILLEEKNITSIDLNISPFQKGFDIFSDGSVWAVPLPGHAPGHIGLYFEFDCKRYFFVSDAVWTQQAILTAALPSWLALYLMDCKTQYKNTIKNLNLVFHENCRLKTQLNIIPCHCSMLVSG